MTTTRLLTIIGWCICSSVGAQSPPTTDRYGEPFPKGAIARFGMLRDGTVNGSRCNDCPPSFSPNGRWVAAANGRYINIWDLQTGVVKKRIVAHDYGVYRLAFAADGSLYSTGLDLPNAKRFISKWDIRTGKAAMQEAQPTREHHEPMFAGEMRFVLSSRFHREDKRQFTTYTIRSTKTNVVVAETKLVGHVAAMDVSPDGKHVVGYTFHQEKDFKKSYNLLQVRDAATGKVIRTLARVVYGDKKKAVYSPDGKTIAGVNKQDTISVWDAATGKKLHTFANGDATYNFLAFSADGKRLANCTRNGSVFVYDLDAGRGRCLNYGHQRYITSLAFSPDGKTLASGGYASDAHVILWNIHSQKFERTIQIVEESEYRDHAARMAFTPDGKWLLIQQFDHSVSMMRVADGREFAPFREVGWPYGFSQDGRTVIWSAKKLEVPVIWRTRRNSISPTDPEFWRQIVNLWTVAQRYPELCRFRYVPYVVPKERPKYRSQIELLFSAGKQHTRAPYMLSPDGSILLETVSRLAGSPSTGMGTYWRPSGYRLSEARTGREIASWDTKDVPLAMSPDGRSIAVLQHKSSTAKEKPKLYLYETRTQKKRAYIGNGNRYNIGFAFSPDGRYAAFCDGGVALYDLTLGRVVSLGEERYSPKQFAFSSDGRRLATTGGDATILLWDVVEALDRDLPKGELTDEKQTRLWNDLAGDDAQKAFAAMMQWKAHPQAAISCFRDRLLNPKRAATIEKWIAALGSKQFSIREKANSALKAQGEFARPYYHRALSKPAPLENRRRLLRLVKALGSPFTSPEGLRMLRAVEVLENIDTLESRRLLADLMKESPDSPLSREAKRSLARCESLRQISQ